MRRTSSLVTGLTLGLFFLAPRADGQRRPALNEFGNPERVAPAPTTSAISVRDLQIRLYQFADDSMQGRQVGRVGNMKGTAYIAAELKRLGLVPAGDNGSYFQVLPYHLRHFTNHSRLTVSGNPLEWDVDWVAIPGVRAPRAITAAVVVFGGIAGDTTRQMAASEVAGKFVVLLPAPLSNPSVARVGGRFAPPAATRFADAVAIAIVDLDLLSTQERRALNVPTIATSSATGRGRPGGPAAPTDSLSLLRQQVDQLAPQAALRMTRDAAARLFGVRSVESLTPGSRGGTVTASLDYVELPSEYARNVAAIIPGSDPAMAGQFVAIGAHNDHVGLTTPVDKDSIKAFNNARNARLLANQMAALSPAQLGAIRVNMDSIRHRFPQPRLDSINNGADDDGSGSMGVLEIAEYIQSMKVKPRRSTLFVWHTGEEAGLVGSAFFTRNPTVPMDSIVAQLNIDMIGRGRDGDLPGGSSDYLGVVGSYFDSKDLGETVAAVNGKQGRALTLDYQFDSTMSWAGYNNIYGRSDHYNYALQGVPIAFFFTGLHGDYHQRSDEAEYIDYPHFARIANYIRDVAVEVGNGPRPRMNGSRPARPLRPTIP
ncbi:MAG: M28 family peptidase [Gemmatimonadota bacterium]